MNYRIRNSNDLRAALKGRVTAPMAPSSAHAQRGHLGQNCWSAATLLNAAVFALGLGACSAPQTPPPAAGKSVAAQPGETLGTQGDGEKVVKTDAEWKEELSPMAYKVLRQKGTERAFSGEYWDHKGDGVYHCAGCGQTLYDSTTKFKSGTGWPSFFRAIDKTHIEELKDQSHGMSRTELLCARCGGHLGHLFNDGPAPTGMRHCINSASLSFKARK